MERCRLVGAVSGSSTLDVARDGCSVAASPRSVGVAYEMPPASPDRPGPKHRLTSSCRREID